MKKEKTPMFKKVNYVMVWNKDRTKKVRQYIYDIKDLNKKKTK
tara:strand:- start:347 stop:475 length:129 start_codon:yes stop_codon:yes gene_type:complete